MPVDQAGEKTDLPSLAGREVLKRSLATVAIRNPRYLKVGFPDSEKWSLYVFISGCHRPEAAPVESTLEHAQ